MNAGATSCRCSPVIFKVFMFLCLAFSRLPTHGESATVDSYHGPSINAICFLSAFFERLVLRTWNTWLLLPLLGPTARGS